MGISYLPVTAIFRIWVSGVFIFAD